MKCALTPAFVSLLLSYPLSISLSTKIAVLSHTLSGAKLPGRIESRFYSVRRSPLLLAEVLGGLCIEESEVPRGSNKGCS